MDLEEFLFQIGLLEHWFKNLPKIKKILYIFLYLSWVALVITLILTPVPIWVIR